MCILFLPQGVKIELIFSLVGSGFRHMGRISKLQYLCMKLNHWQKFQKLHIRPLNFYPVGGGIEFIFMPRAEVSEIKARFQNWCIEHEIWNLTKSSRSCLSALCQPRWSKLSLLFLYGQQFLRYRPIYKFAIFGHEIWHLKKVSEVDYKPSFYTKGCKFSLFSLYRQRFHRAILTFS